MKKLDTKVPVNMIKRHTVAVTSMLFGQPTNSVPSQLSSNTNSTNAANAWTL